MKEEAYHIIETKALYDSGGSHWFVHPRNGIDMGKYHINIEIELP